MNDPNQGLSSAPEGQVPKRKRGRPPKDNSIDRGNSAVTVAELNESSDEEPPNVVVDANLLGQEVSGVISGTFDAGYFVTVKPLNSNITLSGLVFSPGKVLPITPENDLAPKEIMYKRMSPENQLGFQTPQPVVRVLDTQVPSSSASKSESKNTALMVECDQDNEASYSLKGHESSNQGFEIQMGSYYTPVENLQDYRIVDHDEIMKEFEASACLNVPSASASKPGDFRLESMSELQSAYPENLIGKDSTQNQEPTSKDPCLKLIDSANPACSGFSQAVNFPSEAVASFDVNERPSIDDATESQTRSTMVLHSMEHVRSDLQLGLAEAKYSTSAKVYHSGTQNLPSGAVEKKNHDKPSEPPFFFNLTEGNKKSVTESLSFTLGETQATRKANNPISDQPAKETVSSELKLSATITATPLGSSPTETMRDKLTDA